LSLPSPVSTPFPYTTLFRSRQWRQQPTTTAHVTRFVVNPPPTAAFNFAGRDAGPVTVSPDGTRIAFVATTADGAKELYVRSLDAVSAQRLPGTTAASYPFWSADSQNLGFFPDATLKPIAAN